MALKDPHLAWLRLVVGGADAAEEGGPRLAARTAAVEKYAGEADLLRGDLKKANEKLLVTWPDPEVLGFWESCKKKLGQPVGNAPMPWLTGDRDEEADSVHDLVDNYMVNTEDAVALQKLHAQVVEIQERMAAETGPDGEPLFSVDDIRRELWTPLIEANAIPSNAVADKYSQEAVVFKGACDLYKTRLEEYTKTASHFERAQQVLRIATATASLAGTVAKSGMELSAIGATDISTNEIKANDEKLKQLQEIKDKFGDPPGTEDQKELAKLLTTQTAAFKDKVDASKQAAKDLKEQVAIATLAISAVQGALGTADKLLDLPSEKKAWAVAETAWGAIGTTVGDSFGVWAAGVAKEGSAYADSAAFKDLAARGPTIVKSALAGGKLVFRVREAVVAKKDGDRTKAVKSIITGFADTLFYAITAIDAQSGKGSDGEKVKGTDGEFAKIAAYVKLAVVKSADAYQIGVALKAEYDKSGSFPKGDQLAKLLGLGALDVISIASVVSLPSVEDAVRTRVASPVQDQIDDGVAGEDIVIDKTSAFTETLANAIKREAGDGATMGKDIDGTAAFAKLVDWPDSEDPAEQARAIAIAQARQEAAEKNDAIDTLRDKLKKDEEFRAQFVEMLKNESDKGVEEVLQATQDAMPPAEELSADPEAAKKAMDAVEKLIAEAAALNAKWTIMAGIAKGGTSALVAALPVAGLASSITQLATDIAILVRKSYHVNKWRQNMALTYGNSSVYGTSIQRQLDNCAVQVSQQTIVTVLDMVGVAADALKLADLSGVGGAVGAVGHGMQAANTMAKALTEYGFKMYTEFEIEKGWNAYKAALEKPGDRKAARTAMAWNGTLSKCVIAYGIVIDKDPIAKEVGRSCGLTPEILADQKDVCPKIVKYFETLYSDDPVVLRRSPARKKWHPGKPVPTLDSWLRFKAAAADKADPPLAQRSLQTAAIDGALARLAAAIGSDGDYAASRDARFPYTDDLLSGLSRAQPEYKTFLDAAHAAALGLRKALISYAPETDPSRDAGGGSGGKTHEEMAAVVESLTTQCDDILSAVEFDRKEFMALSNIPEPPDAGAILGENAGQAGEDEAREKDKRELEGAQ